MAKLKKSVRGKSRAAQPSADLQAKAEQMSRSIVDSAQQIWMAGVGAFTRAQGEGSKLFEALVKEGMTIEKSTRQLATGKVDAVRDAVEDRVGVVRERAVDTWDRLEKVFEDRVQRALNRLGVPSSDDLADLSKRVNELNAELRKISKSAPARKAAKKTAKPAAKARKAKPAARKAKAVRKPARKAGLPRTAKPKAPQSN